MSNYAINVRCTKCGNWVVVVNPGDSFDETKFVCDDCWELSWKRELRMLREFYDYVRANHPDVLEKYLRGK